MARRLEANFDRAVHESLQGVDLADLRGQLTSYLGDAHAIESQALQLLEQAPGIAGDSDRAKVFSDHLEETRSQQAAVEAPLETHGATPSRFKDALLRIGGVNLVGCLGAQPDTPPKLAGFAFAFEHLEVAAYELLQRVALLAGDPETVAHREADRDGRGRGDPGAVRAGAPNGAEGEGRARVSGAPRRSG
jgi:ferritin-like metal-binding protein YciE